MFARQTKVLAGVAVALGVSFLACGAPPAREGGEVEPSARLHAYDVLDVRVTPTPREAPIDGQYLVGPDGKLRLGPDYGKVKVAGLTLEEATAAVRKQAGRVLKRPKVSVKLAGQVRKWRTDPARKAPYRIQPGQVLNIWVDKVLPYQPIKGEYTVAAGGTVDLRFRYGAVAVKGLTLEQAEDAIRQRLRFILEPPSTSRSPRAGGRSSGRSARTSKASRVTGEGSTSNAGCETPVPAVPGSRVSGLAFS